MTFPDINWLGLNKGWEDRGLTGTVWSSEMQSSSISICSDCNIRLRIGIDSDKSAFIYCPACLRKVKKQHETNPST